MEKSKMKEAQYQCMLDAQKNIGLPSLGLMSGYCWLSDPKHLLFHLSRYKFVSKCFNGFTSVLEVGCADGFGTRIVSQEVKTVTAIDFDPIFIRDAREKQKPPNKIEFLEHDILKGPLNTEFDGIFSMDVLEHIAPEQELSFLKNIVKSLASTGTLILGTPSLQSQMYASKASKEGHINCKDHLQLRSFLKEFFNNVFLFSMNDEVVHTGFYPMAHYLIALCCCPKPLT